MTERIVTLLATRGNTHGDFRTNGRLSQKLKDVLRESQWWRIMPAEQREALDMICLKMSRIVSGRSCFPDHWDDISGYAQLISLEIAGHGEGAEPMPKGTKVHEVYDALKEKEGMDPGKAARIAQAKTGQALATGKPPKKPQQPRGPKMPKTAPEGKYRKF